MTARKPRLSKRDITAAKAAAVHLRAGAPGALLALAAIHAHVNADAPAPAPAVAEES